MPIDWFLTLSTLGFREIEYSCLLHFKFFYRCPTRKGNDNWWSKYFRNRYGQFKKNIEQLLKFPFLKNISSIVSHKTYGRKLELICRQIRSSRTM